VTPVGEQRGDGGHRHVEAARAASRDRGAGSVQPVDDATGRWSDLADRHPDLLLLVLIGSRAAGREHPGSDWDFGVLGGPGLDLLDLRADLVDIVGVDEVDVADLTRASAVLRRDTAVSGRLVMEREPGAFTTFQVQAVTFWADVEPVIREAHADVLRAAAG
jgi:predicted nucleotidyltransferase